jgi:hypothetical protein
VSLIDAQRVQLRFFLELFSEVTMKRGMTRVGNRIGVWMYRTLNGRLASGSKHVHDERDAMWRDTILAQAPAVSRYAKEAGRTIPVAVLEPL